MRRALLALGLVVTAALATAVPATAAPAANPIGHHAPKGIPPFGRSGATARTDSGSPPASFLYADAAQLAVADGTFADVTVE